MQFEVVKKSHRKEIIIGVVAIILIAVVLLVRNSFAKYQTIKNLKIAEGTINYTVPDFKILGIYYQKEGQTCTEDSCYEEKETMPESGYEINASKSYCELNGATDENAEMYTDESGQHVIAKITKGDRCYLYFDKSLCSGSACKTILANVTVKDGTPNFEAIAITDEGVFKAQDDDGDTYYWRGAVTNNYVKFGKHSLDIYDGYYSLTSSSYKEYNSLSECQSASSYNVNCTKSPKAGKDMYWRIVRINGDETIRLIYDGTARANGTSSKDTQIGTSAFNTSRDNNMYVGFMYQENQVHGLGTKSTILSSTNTVGLETWYTTNLDKIGIKEKIDENAGFCGDRTPSTSPTSINKSGGTSTTKTYYGGYIRLMNSTKAPSLECLKEDFYTVNTTDTSNRGNKALDYPIGLITADEIVMAGGVYATTNKSYYLYTGQSYWTLSPYNYTSSYPNASVFLVNSNGVLNNVGVHNVDGVRPVINLKANTKFTYKDATTKGTMNDPYVVE